MSRKKQKKERTLTSEGRGKTARGPVRTHRFSRYCLVLLLAGASALAWMSLLTFHAADPPSKVVVALGARPIHNAAGVVGAYVAYHLLYYLGGGVYMALLFLTIAAFNLVLGGRIGELPWRIIGVALLLVSTSTGIYMGDPTAPQWPVPFGAGVLGKGCGAELLSRFAAVGGWIVVGVAFAIGLMLTAERLVLQLPRLGKRAWDKRREIAAFVGETGVALVGERGEAVGATSAGRGDNSAAKQAHAEDKPAKQAATDDKPRKGAKDAEPQAVAEPSPAAPPIRLVHKPAAAPRAEPRPEKKPAPVPQGDRPYDLPSTDLLLPASGGYLESQEAYAQARGVVLQQTFNDFGVEAQVVGHQTGPVITLFEVSLAPGVKVSQVSNLATDIARALAVPGVRVVSPLPGRDTIGIEVPNLDKEIVRIRELMELAPDADKKMSLPLYLGKDAGGDPIVSDLGRMPHMLIAGTTGSGKSVCINAIIMAMLMTRRPEEVRLILVDPKMVEMAAFEDVPHLLCPIVNDMRRAEEILEWAATKMDERYEVLKEAGVKNIAQFNRLSPEEIYKRFSAETDEDKAGIPTQMPYYVIIVDELADLVMTADKEVETHIIRIAQKARAVGIHLILATQRPSVNVVTGLIKSNMPCRISFRVASRQESRIVLDQNGAEVLLGQGDMLFLKPGCSTLARAQGTYVDDGEIRSVVDELRKKGQPKYDTELMRLDAKPIGEGGGEKDELFDKAVEIILVSQRGSVSLLQRRLAVGYSRASRLIDQMADAGILGDYKGSQARECLLTLEDWQAMKSSAQADLSGESALNGEPTSV
jgi:S-DNA-T family DNA segregation ATPase FtsK/SpoIIIE